MRRESEFSPAIRVGIGIKSAESRLAMRVSSMTYWSGRTKHQKDQQMESVRAAIRNPRYQRPHPGVGKVSGCEPPQANPMTQQALDFTCPIPVNVSVIASEAPRLSKQCRLILERLRANGGTSTNRELCDIALKYTSRISDLRSAGYRVDVIERNHETGLTVYRLTV